VLFLIKGVSLMIKFFLKGLGILAAMIATILLLVYKGIKNKREDKIGYSTKN
jgi:hypothetical protein